MTGLEMIVEKFRTNVDHKGYDAAHDDAHTDGELCAAANCYFDRAWLQIQGKDPRTPERPPFLWPFEPEAWKPSDDPVRNLVHAGALIAAEIDRLQRTRC